MGGSFGGYMANWVAGNTDRFRCIITHASIWSLEPFRGTTDGAAYWDREFGTPEDDPARYREHSPDRLAGAIRTPMLVIHGEKDYRVPIGEALQLWTDLKFRGVDAKFLYFPDENHWILKPRTPGSGTRRCSPSSTTTSSARTGRARPCSRGEAARQPQTRLT
jgi:dipeptidyl aminopeptidase/acylaminoacyl peptidase